MEAYVAKRQRILCSDGQSWKIRRSPCGAAGRSASSAGSSFLSALPSPTWRPSPLPRPPACVPRPPGTPAVCAPASGSSCRCSACALRPRPCSSCLSHGPPQSLPSGVSRLTASCPVCPAPRSRASRPCSFQTGSRAPAATPVPYPLCGTACRSGS